MSRIKTGFCLKTNKTLIAAEATVERALNIKDKVFLGNINVTLLETARIFPDPNNPRNLEITREEILAGFNLKNPEYFSTKQKITNQKKINDIEQLEKLANSIRSNGLLNAIVVYKEGEYLHIVTGERRFLSCLLLGYESIPAKILNKKPNDLQLRIIQWAENCDREDLTAWDRLENIRNIIQSYINENNESISSRKLAEIIHIGKSQAAKYLQLLKESLESPLIKAIKENEITSLKVAEFISSIQDSAIKNRLINLAKNGVALSELKRKAELQNTNGSAQQLKNQTSKLKFVSPKKSIIARFIINSLINNNKLIEYKDRFANIDWSQPQEINKAWEKILMTIENEISEDEYQ